MTSHPQALNRHVLDLSAQFSHARRVCTSRITEHYPVLEVYGDDRCLVWISRKVLAAYHYWMIPITQLVNNFVFMDLTGMSGKQELFLPPPANKRPNTPFVQLKSQL